MDEHDLHEVNPDALPTPAEPVVAEDPLVKIEKSLQMAGVMVASEMVQALCSALGGAGEEPSTRHPARALHLIEVVAHKQLELMAAFNAEARSYLPPPEEGEYGATNPGETFGATLIRDLLPIIKPLLESKLQPKPEPSVQLASFYGIDAAIRAIKDAKELGDEELVTKLRAAVWKQIGQQPEQIGVAEPEAASVADALVEVGPEKA